MALIAALMGALSLTACGRNGPLELPPGPGIAQPGPYASSASPKGALTPMAASSEPTGPAQEAAKTGFDAQGNPVAAASTKKNFVLDPLLR